MPFARVKHPGDNPPRALTPPAPPVRPPPAPSAVEIHTERRPLPVLPDEDRAGDVVVHGIDPHPVDPPVEHVERDAAQTAHGDRPLPHAHDHRPVALEELFSRFEAAASPRAGQARRTGAERTAGGPPPYTVPTQTSFRTLGISYALRVNYDSPWPTEGRIVAEVRLPHTTQAAQYIHLPQFVRPSQKKVHTKNHPHHHFQHKEKLRYNRPRRPGSPSISLTSSLLLYAAPSHLRLIG